MSKQLKNLLYISIPIFSLIMMEWSCKKKDVFPSQQLPQIISLSPASAKAGTQVTIKGSNLKGVSDVRFGTVGAINFNAGANTDTAISVTVPDSLPLGPMYLQVYLPDGKGYASHQFTVLLTPPVPKIDSVSPTKALPGASVIISGINFSLVTSVRFGGVNATFGPTLDTNHKIQATVPLAAGPGNQYITVINPNGEDSIPFNVDFSPVVNSFSPASASAGDLITVSGVRFTGTTSIMLGAASITYTAVNDSTITFNVPSGAISGAITVTTPYGSGTSKASLSILVAGLSFPIYDEAVTSNWTSSGWIGGGWGGSVNYSNTSPAETGTHSARIDYVGGYGSPLQLGGASINLSPYSSFKISIYGGPGSNGLKINIGINQADSYTITLVEGQWTDYQIALASLTSSSTLTDIWIKEYNGTGGFSIYVDNMGLN
jgi:hypothetical protein